MIHSCIHKPTFFLSGIPILSRFPLLLTPLLSLLVICSASGERLETEPTTSEWPLGLSGRPGETAGLCLAASAVCYSVNMKIAGRHGLYSAEARERRCGGVSTMREGGRVGADIGTRVWTIGSFSGEYSKR